MKERAFYFSAFFFCLLWPGKAACCYDKINPQNDRPNPKNLLEGFSSCGITNKKDAVPQKPGSD
jgi:hypothetical protein